MIRGEITEPPEPVCKSLAREFSSPYNIEWMKHKEYYEAVFYVRKQEYLARFRTDGSLVDYSINIPAESIPARILKTAGSAGEIMNAVARHSGEEISYEIICRDRELNRFLLLIDSNAGVMSRQAL